jgi:hypothetical protein
MALVGNKDFRNSARISNLPKANTAGQPITFEQLGDKTLSPNFSSLTASRSCVPGTIADGTTLTKALHVGNVVFISGGTVNLPLDTDWGLYDEIEFISVGITPTVLQWTGFSIVAQDVGSASSQVVGGALAAGAIVKKIASGVAYLFSGSSNAINAIATTIGTNPVTPAIGSTADYVFDNAAGLIQNQLYVFAGVTGTFRFTVVTGNTATLRNIDATVGTSIPAGTKLGPTGSIGATGPVATIGTASDSAVSLPVTGEGLQYDSVPAKWVNLPIPLAIDSAGNWAYVLPASSTTVTQIGIALTTVGTFATPQPASPSFYTRANRFTLTSAATAGSLASLRCATQKLWRGNAAGAGGFKIVIPFGGAMLVAGMRAFVGISSSGSSATNVDPLVDTTAAKVGMAGNNNTGTWTLICGAAAATPTQVSLSAANFPIDATTWYELVLSCLPNGDRISYIIRNRSNNTSVSGDLLTNLPANTLYMHFFPWICNNATASAVGLAYGKIGIFYRE